MFRALWLLLLVLAVSTAAKKDQPEISQTSFTSPLTNLFYFDDSDVIIAIDSDARVVHRSKDAGASWKKVPEIDEGYMVRIRPHPYNNQVAVALGIGLDHWITKDQGESWSKIATRNPPMSMPDSAVIFHATDPDKIIFMTQTCPDGDCTGQVSHNTAYHGSSC